MDIEIKRMAEKWGLKWQFLLDVYFLMLNDARFYSCRKPFGVSYKKMSRHLFYNYGIEISPHQLKYLVCLIKTRKH